jgi:hypothetical protein
MTSPSKKRGPGRPLGVKNGQGGKKKPVKKVVINTEAILANSEVKKLTTEVTRLKEELNSANLHIVKVENQHKAALIVIGYLEGKIFRE